MQNASSGERAARLVRILRALSVRKGRFVLASGRESDFYVDARQTTLNAEGAWLVGSLVLDLLPPDVVGVGGLSLGADPVACATSAVAFAAGRTLHAFLVRKEAKGHGTARSIEGLASLPPGSRVAIVEDTTTTGGSLLDAVRRARAAGLDVACCVAVVDRQEGASEFLAQHGLALHALVTRAELERTSPSE